MKTAEIAEPWEPVDPPTPEQAVYATTDQPYAQWYAARSRGDLYEVTLVGEVKRSKEDHFPTWHAPEAVVLRVLERRVRLTRKDRRALMRRWKKADKRQTRNGQISMTEILQGYQPVVTP